MGPINQVKDYYVHIGVPQAQSNQSKIIVDNRIAKSQDTTYKLQGATTHFLVSYLQKHNVTWRYLDYLVS